jgi:hypothetical protein
MKRLLLLPAVAVLALGAAGCESARWCHRGAPCQAPCATGPAFGATAVDPCLTTPAVQVAPGVQTIVPGPLPYANPTNQ